MLFLVIGSLVCYYGLLFLVGLTVKSLAIEGTLIAFAVICFIGAYFARKSRFVRRMANWIGGICCAVLAVQSFLLPVLNKDIIIGISVITGIAMYIFSRRFVHQKLLKKDTDGNRPSPPFNKEWVRWLIAFGL